MISDVLTAQKNYSYVNARVRTRRGNLVTDAEYRKLMKMDLSEIAEFLGKRGYDREMEALGSDHEGEELLEKAVRQNLARTYRELMQMADEPVQELLSIYFRKFDIENVKTILRATIRGEEDIDAMLVPTRELDREALERMQAMQSPEEVLDAFQLSGFNGDPARHVDDMNDLAAVEDALDIYYYANLVEKVEDVGGRSELFREFLELEAVLKNVSLVLRMTRQGFDRGDIEDRLIPVPSRKRVDPHELAAIGSEEEILERLRATPIGEHMDGDSPAEVQQALETYKLKQGIRLMHADQLGVNPVIGFMVCKEVEARNLQLITRATAEGLGEAFIERNIVEGVAS